MRIKIHVLWCVAMAAGFGTFAQAPPASPTREPAAQVAAAPPHPWQVPAPRYSSDAYFTNLKDGAVIETPFRATFGLAGGWGLAPIASPLGGKSGHHHLLLNKNLPLDFEKPLPFNDQYLHFGKGQMETVLNLEPGTYDLRLLLANHKHVLHFVYSSPIKVTVSRKNSSIDPKSLTKKGISLLNLASDTPLKPPFRVQFHASGLNVAHQSQQEKDTGHFRLTVKPQGGKPAELNFTNGQTEVWLSPPAGAYSLMLEFVDNMNLQKTLVEAVSQPILVE